MVENFENQRETGSASDLDIGTRLSNEANVLGSGFLGSFSKIGDGLEEAKKDPVSFGLKAAGGLTVGLAIGALTREAGFWGCVGRGTLGAVSVSGLTDAFKPLGSAMKTAWNATSQQQLDSASQKLASNLGQFEFDTLATMPFAVGGAALGGGLRRSLAGTVSLQSETKIAEAAAAKVRPAEATASRTATGYQSRLFGENAFRAEPQPKPRKIYVGEIVDDPPPRSGPRPRKPEPDIIDAEFTVIDEKTTRGGELNFMKIRGDFRPDLLPPSKTALTLAQREDGSQFALIARHPAVRTTLDNALKTVNGIEPGWTLDRGILHSPVNTRLTPFQLTDLLYHSPSEPPPPPMEKVIKAYTESSEEEPPHLIDIKV